MRNWTAFLVLAFGSWTAGAVTSALLGRHLVAVEQQKVERLEATVAQQAERLKQRNPGEDRCYFVGPEDEMVTMMAVWVDPEPEGCEALAKLKFKGCYEMSK